MVNGYINPYDILYKESDLPFFVELNKDFSFNLVLDGKKKEEEIQTRVLERIAGVGVVSTISTWAGSYLVKDYYKRCQSYIEEEVRHLQTDSSQMIYDFKMSLVVFITIGKWLDIIDYKSNELRESARLTVKIIKHLSLSEALMESMEEDLASGKLTKWFEFSMSSFICLLAHCWKCLPYKRDIIMWVAKNTLFNFKFNTDLLEYSVYECLKYHIDDINRFGSINGQLVHRKKIVNSIVDNSSAILANIEDK